MFRPMEPRTRSDNPSNDQAGCRMVVAKNLVTESPPRPMGSSPTTIRGGVHSGRKIVAEFCSQCRVLQPKLNGGD